MLGKERRQQRRVEIDRQEYHEEKQPSRRQERRLLERLRARAGGDNGRIKWTGIILAMLAFSAEILLVTANTQTARASRRERRELEQPTEPSHSTEPQRSGGSELSVEAQVMETATNVMPSVDSSYQTIEQSLACDVAKRCNIAVTNNYDAQVDVTVFHKRLEPRSVLKQDTGQSRQIIGTQDPAAARLDANIIRNFEWQRDYGGKLQNWRDGYKAKFAKAKKDILDKEIAKFGKDRPTTPEEIVAYNSIYDKLETLLYQRVVAEETLYHPPNDIPEAAARKGQCAELAAVQSCILLKEASETGRPIKVQLAQADLNLTDTTKLGDHAWLMINRPETEIGTRQMSRTILENQDEVARYLEEEDYIICDPWMFQTEDSVGYSGHSAQRTHSTYTREAQWQTLVVDDLTLEFGELSSIKNEGLRQNLQLKVDSFLQWMGFRRFTTSGQPADSHDPEGVKQTAKRISKAANSQNIGFREISCERERADSDLTGPQNPSGTSVAQPVDSSVDQNSNTDRPRRPSFTRNHDDL